MSKSIELLNFEGPVLQLIRNGQEFIVIDQWKKTVAKLSVQGVLAYCAGDITIIDSAGKEWCFLKEHEEARVKMNKLTEFLFNSNPTANKSFTWDLFLQDIEDYPSPEWPDAVYYGYMSCIKLIKQKAVNYHPPKFRQKK